MSRLRVAEMEQRADDGPDGRPIDTDDRTQNDRPEDDAQVVEDRCQAVAQEALPGDEHLAEGERGGEDECCHEHDPEELDVELALGGVEAGHDPGGRQRGDDEEDHVGHGHQQDGHRQDGAAELGRATGVVLARPAEDGHEGGREAGDDEHVQDQLGDDERRVVGVQLDASAERPCERSVAQEAHGIGGEGQGGEQDGAPRQEPQQPIDDGPHPASPQGVAVAPGDAGAEALGEGPASSSKGASSRSASAVVNGPRQMFWTVPLRSMKRWVGRP